MDAVKAVPRGEAVALDVCDRKQGRLRVVMVKEREKQMKPTESGGEEGTEKSKNQWNSKQIYNREKQKPRVGSLKSLMKMGRHKLPI